MSRPCLSGLGVVSAVLITKFVFYCYNKVPKAECFILKRVVFFSPWPKAKYCWSVQAGAIQSAEGPKE